MTMRWGVAWVAMAGLLAAAVAGEVDQPSPQEVIQRLKAELTSGEKPPQRPAAQLGADYAVAIDHLVGGLKGDDTSQWKNADSTLEELCHLAFAPGFEPHRIAAARALTRHVRDQRLTALGRGRVIRHIERIGRAEVVDALAAALADKELREPARRALMRNPAAEAGDALRDALNQADTPSRRIALIDALGFRREQRFIKPLVAQAGHADFDVRLHAVEALARIGSPKAQTAVMELLGKGEGHARDQANDAYLALAGRLADADEKAAALTLFRALLDAKEPHLQCAALVGIGRAGSAKDVDTLVGAFGCGVQQRETATRALIALSDEAATEAIWARAKAAAAAVKTRLVGVLGQRKDPAAIPHVIEAAKDKDASVRVGAYTALGHLEAQAGLPVLVQAVKTGGDEERAAAEKALGRIPGEATADAIAEAVPTTQKAAKAALVRALACHHAARHLDVFLAAAKDDAPKVQVAALRGIGVLNQAKAVPTVLEILNEAEGEVLAAAGYALRRSRSPEATAAMVKEARKASAEALAVLLRILAWRDHPAAQGLLLASARHDDPAVQTAAIEGLAHQKTSDAVPILIEAATGEKGDLRDAAVRASLAYVDEIAKANPDAAREIFALALNRRIVRADDLRRQAARALGRLGAPEAVEALCSALRDRRVGRDAHNAIHTIAQQLVKDDQKDEAVEVYTQLLLRSNDERWIRRVADELKKLGVEGRVARRAGFITRWLVCGPFPNPRNKLLSTKLPPEEDGAEPTEPFVEALGVRRDWKRVTIEHPAGIVDLRQAVAEEPNVGALLYAEVTVPEACKALLKLGYEEGCVAYLNAKQVHSRAGARFRIDDRQVRVSLQEGMNRILLKVAHLTRGWRVCARLTTAAHEALAFEQGGK
ncbi:MAG: HEAT repeat domain-containing protein [bacterium]